MKRLAIFLLITLFATAAQAATKNAALREVIGQFWQAVCEGNVDQVHDLQSILAERQNLLS